MPTPKQEIEKLNVGRPHVVLLGAGASLAALPNGDKHGNPLPLMNNLIDILDLGRIFDQYNIQYSPHQNFEDIYNNLYERNNYPELLKQIEDRVRNYFTKLALPDYPTIYDHLLLSLRDKDIIATFNWDPLLYAAGCRNYGKAPLPHLAFLHGNVAIGYCLKDRVKGNILSRCPKCGDPFTPSKLLFPIKQKDYISDPLLNAEWQTLKAYLKDAYIFTVFGYSAPSSDIEAKNLMMEAWGAPTERNLEEIEIIDTKDPELITSAWKGFIHSHHYQIASDFYYSFTAKHPRRTCEAMWSCLMEIDPYRDNDIPKSLGFESLYEWYRPLLDVEKGSK